MCIALVGALVSGIGTAASIAQANAQADAQAELLEQQAEQMRKKGAYEAARKREEVARVQGEQRAGLTGGRGLALSGSATDVLAASGTEGLMDVGAIIANANNAADMKHLEARMQIDSKDNGLGTALGFIAPVLNVAANAQTSEGGLGSLFSIG